MKLILNAFIILSLTSFIGISQSFASGSYNPPPSNSGTQRNTQSQQQGYDRDSYYGQDDAVYDETEYEKDRRDRQEDNRDDRDDYNR